MFKVLTYCLVIITVICQTAADNNTTCPPIVTKQRWGARTAIHVPYIIIPVPNVIIHHTVTPTCSTKLDCAKIIANIQNYHMNELKFDDIGYNFIIGNDGRVYEGCGWHIEGAHTFKWNKNSIGIGFVGDFSAKLPSVSALDAAKQLLRCGVETGEIDRNYKLYGGRQIIATESPGIELYGEIQDWDNWSSTV